MRKFQKAAVVVTMLGSVGFLGAGVSHANGGDPSLKVDSKQGNACGNQKQEGVLNIGRLNVQLLGILANQPVDQNLSGTCTNGLGVGH